MRLIHVSDLHLGTTTYGREDPSTGVNRRVQDFFKSFDHIVSYAVDKTADVILLCGDIFKDVNPTPTLLKMFAGRLRKLISKNIKVIIIPGNHDSPKTTGKTSPPEIFHELNLEGVHVITKPSFIDLVSKRGVKLRVFAIPYIHPALVGAKRIDQGPTHIELNRDRILAAYHSELKGILETFKKTGRDGVDLPILAAHLFVKGARRGAERIYIVGEEYTVPPEMLQLDIFDYVALGHVHSHQLVPGRVPTVYAGSIEKVDFSEAGEEKGFVDVTYKDGRLDWRFIPILTRRMIRMDIDSTSLEEAEKYIAKEIEKVGVKEAIVRVKLTTKPESRLKLEVIQEKLASAFWSEIIFERQVGEKVSEIPSISSLDPRVTLSRYLKNIGSSDINGELLEKLGREIIDEVTAEAERA